MRFSCTESSSISHFFCQYVFSHPVGRPRQDADHLDLNEKRDGCPWALGVPGTGVLLAAVTA